MVNATTNTSPLKGSAATNTSPLKMPKGSAATSPLQKTGAQDARPETSPAALEAELASLGIPIIDVRDQRPPTAPPRGRMADHKPDGFVPPLPGAQEGIYTLEDMAGRDVLDLRGLTPRNGDGSRPPSAQPPPPPPAAAATDATGAEPPQGQPKGIHTCGMQRGNYR